MDQYLAATCNSGVAIVANLVSAQRAQLGAVFCVIHIWGQHFRSHTSIRASAECDIPAVWFLWDTYLEQGEQETSNNALLVARYKGEKIRNKLSLLKVPSVLPYHSCDQHFHLVHMLLSPVSTAVARAERRPKADLLHFCHMIMQQILI